MKRSASAAWSGGLKDGKGTVSTESGVLSDVPYNFSKRFENEKGTNPEELIAAARGVLLHGALHDPGPGRDDGREHRHDGDGFIGIRRRALRSPRATPERP